METLSEGAVVTENGRLVSRTCEVPDVSYRAFLSGRGAPRIYWATPDGFEVVGVGAAAMVTASGSDRFGSLQRDAVTLFEEADSDGPEVARPRAFGGLSFGDAHESASPWDGFPAAGFVVPRTTLTRAEGTTWLTVTEVVDEPDTDDIETELERSRQRVVDLPMLRPTSDPPGVLATRLTAPREEWTEQVARAVDRIRDGALRKVTLATSMEVDLESELTIPAALERFRRTYPNCYRFLVQPTDDAAFFGPPPERLVRLRGSRIETEALAGSMPRGETPTEDNGFADALVESEKIRHEQQLVVDAIREQLEPIADVRCGDRGIRKLANIQHLHTPIRASLDTDVHVLEVVEALHPTPAVGGLPLSKALATIEEIESFDRGWYAAPIGWFDGDGDGEFAVGIRSGVASGDRVTLFAGNGIVADSDPDEEWEEVQPKFRPVLEELER